MNQSETQLLQITPTSLIVYNEYQFRQGRSEKSVLNEVNLTRGNYNGYISIKAKRTITKRLNAWLNSLIHYNKTHRPLSKKPQRKPTFITLTLPSTQLHNDKELKRFCLMPFLERLKNKYNVKHYFWVAEAQKNGNLHFHIIIDSYVHHAKVRAFWNKDLEKLGYVTQFENKHGHRNPNSTDIHIVGGFESAIKYVVKYVSKSTSQRKISGRIHGMSSELRDLKAYTTLIDESTSDFITDAMIQKGSKVFRGDHFTVIYCNVQALQVFKESPISLEFYEWMNGVYKYLYENHENIMLKVAADVTEMIDPNVYDNAEFEAAKAAMYVQLEFEMMTEPKFKRLQRIKGLAIQKAI